jgi:hypothetical protein
MQAAEELRPSFAKPLSRASAELRARQAAIELWGTAGPPEHLSNSLICREAAEWLKKNGQAADISDVTILRAVSS